MRTHDDEFTMEPATLADLIAVLRDAGYETYRPDECEPVTVSDGGSYADHHTGKERQAEPVLKGSKVEPTRCLMRIGEYRLVPVGESNE